MSFDLIYDVTLITLKMISLSVLDSDDQIPLGACVVVSLLKQTVGKKEDHLTHIYLDEL